VKNPRNVFLLILMAGAVFFLGRGLTGKFSNQSASDAVCSKSTEEQISGSDSFTHQRLSPSSLELRLESSIRQSTKDVKFLTSIFINDIQVPELTSSYVIPCGKSHILKSIVKNVAKKEVISTFYWRYPDIPQRILEINPDGLKKIPESTLANTATFQTNTHREGTFTGTPSAVAQTRVSMKHQKQVPLNHLKFQQNYLIEQGSDRPTLVKFFDQPRKYQFQMVFAETTNLTSAITITCLLDKKQIRAFGSSISWSGRPKPQHAVVLDAEVSLSGAGWHQLECLAFDNLFQPANREPSTYWTLGTFIHIASDR
jgi:hypothetical protein